MSLQLCEELFLECAALREKLHEVQTGFDTACARLTEQQDVIDQLREERAALLRDQRVSDYQPPERGPQWRPGGVWADFQLGPDAGAPIPIAGVPQADGECPED